MFADPSKTPARLLLTFHHLPFDYEMTDGRSLIENVRLAYALGKENAYNNIFKVWETLKPFFSIQVIMDLMILKDGKTFSTSFALESG